MKVLRTTLKDVDSEASKAKIMILLMKRDGLTLEQAVDLAPHTKGKQLIRKYWEEIKIEL